MRKNTFALVTFLCFFVFAASAKAEEFLFLPLNENTPVITAHFCDPNYITAGCHNGTDYDTTNNSTPVYAAEAGKVLKVVDRYSSGMCKKCGFGNHIRIRHSNGYVTIYAHLLRGSLKVKIGDRVEVGQRLATADHSGFSTGSHLHFEVRDASGTAVDPYGKNAKYPQCGANPLWATCPPTPYMPPADDDDSTDCAPTTEICDNKDNNCDGQVDEDWKKGLITDLGKPCDIGLGECKRTGERVCRFDGKATVCSEDPGTPDCTGKQCGDDGCGGSCGSCVSGKICTAQGMCANAPSQCPSTMDCGSRECGPDPVCGESCGECAPPYACDTDGRCACTPDCIGKVCGEDDECGGKCGATDRDGDGFVSVACGGEDCDDSNAKINPGASDPIEVVMEEDVELDPNIGSDVFTSPSIVLDSDGFPHLSYGCRKGFGQGNCDSSFRSEGRYLSKTEFGWGPVSSFEAYSGTVLLLDGNDNEHLIVMDENVSQGACFYERKKDRGSMQWTQTQIFCDPTAKLVIFDAVIDTDGFLHIAYSDALGSGQLYYATNQAGAWSVQSVGVIQDGYLCEPYLAVDSIGVIHIVSSPCSESPVKEVSYSINTGGGAWSTQAVVFDGRPRALCIDASDVLHLFWSEWSSGTNEVHYHQKKQGIWSEQEIYPPNIYPPFRVTGDGIVYVSDSSFNVRTNLSGTWEGGGEDPIYGLRASAVDSKQGRVHAISYWQNGQGSEMYFSLHYIVYRISNTVDENCDGK